MGKSLKMKRVPASAGKGKGRYNSFGERMNAWCR